MKLGIEIKKENNKLTLKRNTKETKTIVNLNSNVNKQLCVDTTISFLDHMIETLAWNANLNIGIQIESEKNLKHPIAEDIGIALGRTILEYYKSKIQNGVEGFGSAQGIIDEAYANTAINIEGRSNCFIDGLSFENVDGMNGYDLIAFLEGFSQGCRCSLQIRFSGKDPHHAWESVFRSFGLAIRKALEPNIWRKKTIIGMKGTLE